jgi:hypothetical protein
MVFYRHIIVWRLLMVTISLMAFLCLINQSIALAQDLTESFQLDFDPVSFDKTEIHGSEVFHATIVGTLTCTVDLPMSVSEANVTYRVVAVNTTSNMWATLNENYTITMKPVPSKKGETAEINQSVALQFLAQPDPGEYEVIERIVEAKAKLPFGWVNITSFLPQEQHMGMVQYTNPMMSTPLPSGIQSPTTPDGSVPESDTNPENVTPLTIIPWWVWLVVAIATSTTVANIVWFLHHRNKWR